MGSCRIITHSLLEIRKLYLEKLDRTGLNGDNTKLKLVGLERSNTLLFALSDDQLTSILVYYPRTESFNSILTLNYVTDIHTASLCDNETLLAFTSKNESGPETFLVELTTQKTFCITGSSESYSRIQFFASQTVDTAKITHYFIHIQYNHSISQYSIVTDESGKISEQLKKDCILFKKPLYTFYNCLRHELLVVSAASTSKNTQSLYIVRPVLEKDTFLLNEYPLPDVFNKRCYLNFDIFGENDAVEDDNEADAETLEIIFTGDRQRLLLVMSKMNKSNTSYGLTLCAMNTRFEPKSFDVLAFSLEASTKYFLCFFKQNVLWIITGNNLTCVDVEAGVKPFIGVQLSIDVQELYLCGGVRKLDFYDTDGSSVDAFVDSRQKSIIHLEVLLDLDGSSRRNVSYAWILHYLLLHASRNYSELESSIVFCDYNRMTMDEHKIYNQLCYSICLQNIDDSLSIKTLLPIIDKQDFIDETTQTEPPDFYFDVIKGSINLKTRHPLGSTIQIDRFINYLNIDGEDLLLNSILKSVTETTQVSAKKRWGSLLSRFFNSSSSSGSMQNALQFKLDYSSDSSEPEDEIMQIRNNLTTYLGTYIDACYKSKLVEQIRESKSIANAFAQSQLTSFAIIWNSVLKHYHVTTPLDFSDCECQACSALGAKKQKMESSVLQNRRISNNILFKMRDSPRHLSKRFEYVSNVIGARPKKESVENSVMKMGAWSEFFTVLLNFYIANEKSCFPFPVGFHNTFITVGFHALPRSVFLQYLDRGIFRSSEGFINSISDYQESSIYAQCIQRTPNLRNQKHLQNKKLDLSWKERLRSFLDKNLDEKTLSVEVDAEGRYVGVDLFETRPHGRKQSDRDSTVDTTVGSVPRSSPISVPRSSQSKGIVNSSSRSSSSFYKSMSLPVKMQSPLNLGSLQSVIDSPEGLEKPFDFLPFNVFYNYLSEKGFPEKDLDSLLELYK